VKLSRISVTNIIGAAKVDIDVTTPVLILAARNGKGKSSTLDAVEMALTGQPPRGVTLKKNYAQLINDGGAKTGEVTVTTADGAEYWMQLPNGKGAHHDHPALPYVLHAPRLAELSEKERKTTLFNLLGVKVSSDEVKKRMLAKGLDAKKIERVLPLLRSGFETAASTAAEQATQAKGAWKTVTTEQWGSEKAIDWRAAVPEFEQAALDALLATAKETDEALATANQTVGALQTKLQQHANQEKARAELAETASKVDRIKAKLATDEKSLAEWHLDLEKTEAAAGTGERVGLIHGLARALNEALAVMDPYHLHFQRWQGMVKTYEAEHGSLDVKPGDAGALARLPSIRSSVALVTNAVANDKRDLLAAETAKAQLAAMEAGEKPPKESELQAAKDEAASIAQARADLTKQIDTLTSAKRAAADAGANTAKAAQHHADIIQWLAVAEALGPMGIPGELLSEALGPINARLAQSAEDTSWPVVQIHPDMTITYGKRLRQLLSASEKWRADAMLAEAVSNLSGLRMFVLDGFDILEPEGRSQCLAWLDTLAINNEVDTVLVGATLKSADANWAASTSAVWIESGVCEARAAELEAA
jgi:DNA repair exonuclease SbcCD ATPase subunit